MKRKLTALLLSLSLAVSLAACAAPSGGASTPPDEDTEIQVFIAASLENAFRDIIALYSERNPNVTVTYNADSSGTLLTQIQEGYECDLFFSAATSQIDTAQAEGLAVEGSRVDLLKNEVVLITWKGSGTSVTGIENLDQAASIALADGSVPVGKYTRAALQALGILDGDTAAKDVTSQQVSEALGGVEINECGNVSKVKEAIREGANEVGAVYYSDAYSVREDVEILEHVPASLTGDIIYPMIRVVNPEADQAQTAAADDFYSFLQTDEAMAVFEEYMFVSNR